MKGNLSAEKVSDRAPLVLLSDPCKGTILRASSVLQKNTKLYGPMNALDVENGSSSWNSEGNNKGETALVVQFGRAVIPTIIKWQFQAGFSAESCKLYCDVSASDKSEAFGLIDELELEDVHELQSCPLEPILQGQSCSSIKLSLDDFCDFYGRVILYRLEVWGREEE